LGEVVLARRDASGTLVAIKYLGHTLLSDAGFRSQFRSEADALAAVDDPNVVRLHEYVRSPRGAAIVMELIDGVSLRDILAHQGKTTAQAALTVLRGSLLGLAAAHQHGVVHRDYKPENVLINGDGDSKLTDFGIAARTGDCPAPAGTMVYSPPEQLSGSPASSAGDVYAATATFYECLAGRPPFTGDTAERLLYQYLAEPVLLDPVPRPLRPLITVGMATDPDDRPDAATLLTQLTAIAAATYGPHWHQHGRTHLGQTALLLAVLWPSSTPSAPQDTTTEQISLSRRITGLRAAAAVGAVALVAAASTALAVSRPGTRAPAHSIAAAQRISLRPSSPAPLQNRRFLIVTGRADHDHATGAVARAVTGSVLTAAVAGARPFQEAVSIAVTVTARYAAAAVAPVVASVVVLAVVTFAVIAWAVVTFVVVTFAVIA